MIQFSIHYRRLYKAAATVVPLLFFALFLSIFPSTEAMGKENVEIDKATKVQVQETYGKLPLYFIQNSGTRSVESGTLFSSVFMMSAMCFHQRFMISVSGSLSMP